MENKRVENSEDYAEGYEKGLRDGKFIGALKALEKITSDYKKYMEQKNEK